MRDIQASEAKARLLQILDAVEDGETVRITRHGRPIARIVPETQRRADEVDRVIEGLRDLRRRTRKTPAEDLAAMRHEGHKY